MTLMASGPTSWRWAPTPRAEAPRLTPMGHRHLGGSSSMSALSVMSSLPTLSLISSLRTRGVLAAPAATRPGVFG